MPVYNGAEYICDAIDSILAQTHSDFELVISDNASTDQTEAISREYAARDPRVKYHRNPLNVGASENYNSVFRRSVAPLFKWASCNDYCAPQFLERCVEILNTQPDVVLVYPRTRLFRDTIDAAEDYDDDLDIRDDDPVVRFDQIIARMKLNNIMNGVMRAAPLRRTNLIQPFFASDCALMAELALYGKVVEQPEFMFYRRMDEKTSTKLKSAEDVLRHYDPELKNPMLFQEWRLIREYFAAITRSRLSLPRKARAYYRMLRQANWRRHKLGADVVQAMSRYRSRG
jgi:glycosyltransferase involved in cell wall biosynthesis